MKSLIIKSNIYLLLFLLPNSFLMAKIYKYKDAKGQIHYVDDISKIPSSRVKRATTLNTNFLKTDNPDIDKYRELISKHGMYYKDLEKQKIGLILWNNLIVQYGFSKFESDLPKIESISTSSQSGKKLTPRQVREIASQLAFFYKSYENVWPKIYEEINFKPTDNEEIDKLRKEMKQIKTDKNNLENRIKLLNEWNKLMAENEKANKTLLNERLKVIKKNHSVKKPDIYMLSRYVDQTLNIFEKEFRK